MGSGGLTLPPSAKRAAMIRACRQSTVIADRAALEAVYAAALGSASEGLPAHWGGYRVVPRLFEFWQGRESRLHDRLRYRRGGDGAWILERLAP